MDTTIKSLIASMREQRIAEERREMFLSKFREKVYLNEPKFSSKLDKVSTMWHNVVENDDGSTRDKLRATLILSICVAIIHGDKEWGDLAEEAHELLGYPVVEKEEIEKLIG